MDQFICPITELQAERIDVHKYRIFANNECFFISHGFMFNQILNDDIFKANRHLFAGAILNKQLADDNKDGIYWFSLTNETFNEKLSNIIYPKTPKAKLDALFKSLYQLQTFDGEFVSVGNLFQTPEFYFKHFFKSADECTYYINGLKDLGFIHFSNTSNYRITFRGLDYLIELTESGDLSNRCFIAMSFDPEMGETRNVIKSIVLDNGFDPIIIDEKLIDSSQTINDAIISEIKSCKFCIADFTQQKDGVYFECGFAVGLGKPVIYTCSSLWFSKTHFDTNHFPHIIYESHEELKNNLDKKIKAWIK